MTCRFAMPLSLVGIALACVAACADPPTPQPAAAPPAIEVGVAADPAEAAERAAYKAAYERAMAAAKASKGKGQPAMWTVKDSDTTIYLLGTIHLLKPDLVWRSREIDTAFAASSRIVFEIDVSSAAGQRAIMQFLSTHGTRADGATLSSVLSPAEKLAVSQAAESVKLPFDALDAMQPWYAAILLTQAGVTQAGFDPRSGVESVLEAEARQTGKKTAYLETPEEQLSGLARLPAAEQADFLVDTAVDFATLDHDINLLAAEWADGDTAGLVALLDDPQLLGSEAIYKAMIAQRNLNWVPKLEAMLAEPGTVMVAVGTAHLIGEDSVVKSLRDKGHTVTGP